MSNKILNDLNDLMRVIQASTSKSAAELGKSTHPTENAPNNTQTPPEGARYRENSEEVKENNELSVDETADKTSNGPTYTPDAIVADSDLKANATTEGPQVTTKGTKDDDGFEGESSHPARTDNPALGPKNSFDKMTLDEKTQALAKEANDLCADIIVALRKQAQAPETQSAPAAPSKTAGDAEAAGRELAAAVDSGFDKVAMEREMVADLAQVILDAHADAVKVAHVIDGFYRQADDSGMGAPPPGAMPGGDPGQAVDPSMLAALGQGGGPDQGGGDPMMGQGDPSGGAGGAGGAGVEQQIMQAIDVLCQHFGKTPDDIAQVLMDTGAGGGAMGGVPPDAGGPPGEGGPPEAGSAPPPEDPGAPPKTAADRSKQPLPKAAATRVAGMNAMLQEVLSRSRT